MSDSSDEGTFKETHVYVDYFTNVTIELYFVRWRSSRFILSKRLAEGAVLSRVVFMLRFTGMSTVDHGHLS